AASFSGVLQGSGQRRAAKEALRAGRGRRRIAAEFGGRQGRGHGLRVEAHHASFAAAQRTASNAAITAAWSAGGMPEPSKAASCNNAGVTELSLMTCIRTMPLSSAPRWAASKSCERSNLAAMAPASPDRVLLGRGGGTGLAGAAGQAGCGAPSPSKDGRAHVPGAPAAAQGLPRARAEPSEMAGLIASLASGNIEKLLDTQVSRRGLWMSAAAIAAISGATYGVLTWEQRLEQWRKVLSAPTPATCPASQSSAPVGAGSSERDSRCAQRSQRKVARAAGLRASPEALARPAIATASAVARAFPPAPPPVAGALFPPPPSQRVIGAAKLLALKSGSVKNKAGLDAAASASMKKELAEAQAEALKEAGVTASQAAAAWRHFSAVYGEPGAPLPAEQRTMPPRAARADAARQASPCHEASLAADEDDEEDDEDDEDDEDEDAEALPKGDAEARSVVQAGWRVKRAAAPVMMDASMLLEAMAAMGRACERAVPEAFLALQDELEEMGVADMPPQQRQQAIVGRVQRVQPAVVAHGEERMKAEFGLSRTEIGAHLARLQAVDPKIGERSNAALQGFQASMQREMQALVSTMGLG
ncbi:unnamed protein product, partial [Symbiodinium sp. KB8]